MMPMHEKAVVARRIYPIPPRGHVKLSTRWVQRLTLLDLFKIEKFVAPLLARKREVGHGR
jgi:hypothetical protein